MFRQKKKNSVEQKRVDPITLSFFIFTLKQSYGKLKDHALIAQLLNEKFKLGVTRKDIDEYYGFNDNPVIIDECFEDESRKHEYFLKTI